jgi:hypothetical protein
MDRVPQPQKIMSHIFNPLCFKGKKSGRAKKENAMSHNCHTRGLSDAP